MSLTYLPAHRAADLLGISERSSWEVDGYVILGYPHTTEGVPHGMPPLIASYEKSEYDAHRALMRAWERGGEEFFFWISRTRIQFFA